MESVKGTSPLVVTVNGWKDTGKTTLVCALISHFSRLGRVNAVKVCSSKHVSSGTESDTSRMDRSGARFILLLEKSVWEASGSYDHLAVEHPELKDALLTVCEGVRTEDSLGCVVYTEASLADGIKPGHREARLLMHDGSGSVREFLERTRTDDQLTAPRDDVQELIALIEEELHDT